MPGDPQAAAAYDVIPANGKQIEQPRLLDEPSGKPDEPRAVRAMARTPSGDVVVAFDTTDEDSNHVIGVKRIHSAGEVDTGFGANGLANTRFLDENSSFASAVAVRPEDGKIVIAGNRSNSNSSGCGILQLSSAGAPDDEGQMLCSANLTRGLVLLPGGQILAGASTGIVAFSSDGKATTFGSVGATVNDIFLDNQNRVLATAGGALASVWRLTTEGATDPLFGAGGKTTIDPPAGWSPSGSVVAGVQKDGRVIVVSVVSRASRFGAVVSRLWN
jgi:hypothetical protein